MSGYEVRRSSLQVIEKGNIPINNGNIKIGGVAS